MVFAFLLLSALIITEYTTHNVSQPHKATIADTIEKKPVKQSAQPNKRSETNSTNSSVKRFEFVTLTPILFDFNQAKLRDAAKETLDEIAIFIANTPNIERLFIEGNTDHIGSNEYNDELSYNRARSVKEYLIEKGAPESLFVKTGYGEIRPVDEYWTNNGRQRNRQVSLHALINE